MSSIFGYDIFYAFFLHFSCLFKVFYENFVTGKVSNCPFKRLFAARNFNYIIDEASSLDWLDFVSDSIRKLAIRNIGQNKNFQTYWFLF